MCLFCDIAAGKQKADIIFQDKDLVAFYDIHPKAPVHILIVPQKHIESVQKLKEEDALLIAQMILRAKEIAKEKGIAGGYKLIFNCGREGGQVIPHLHLHLLGGSSRRD